MWKLLAALWRPILHGLPEAIQFERVADSPNSVAATYRLFTNAWANGGKASSSGRCLKKMAEKSAPPKKKLTRLAKKSRCAAKTL
ncbi:hypothetical protein HFN62_23215 [Rhizobium leguminosarum]|uniref:hypothetical protein n=1 Tax=Rhizobium leguminosarum TaxID=384 RepID=UPI0015BF2000|nr:hypothetical protein [Rhizobium leguminosarum]MBY5786623.1 hypothetical protein [Rhizobium leguminosarum]